MSYHITNWLVKIHIKGSSRNLLIKYITYLEPEEDTEDSENVDTFVNEASENEFEEISEDTDMAE